MNCTSNAHNYDLVLAPLIKKLDKSFNINLHCNIINSLSASKALILSFVHAQRLQELRPA